MKRQFAIGIIGWLLASLGSYKTVAQEGTAPAKKETQEIIIRKKNDKDTKVLVEISGDKVIINGKPLAEFNEDGISINNRKVIIRDGDHIMLDLDGKMMDLDGKLDDLKNLKNFGFNWSDSDDENSGNEKEYTYLGVNTNKVDQGAAVTFVTAGSPAEKAGLKIDDIIYKLDDTNISSGSDLSKAVRAKKDGDKVKVYYLREGKKKDLKVALSSKKSSSGSFSFSLPDGSKRSLTIPRAPRAPRAPGVPAPPRGFDQNEMFNDGDFEFFTKRQKLGLKIRDTDEGNGVTVLEVEAASAAAAAGIMKDDVITEIGGKKITTTDEAREELQENRDKATYSLKAKRNGIEMPFTIKIPKNLKTATL